MRVSAVPLGLDASFGDEGSRVGVPPPLPPVPGVNVTKLGHTDESAITVLSGKLVIVQV